MAGDLAHTSLMDALRWVESTSATGSMRVDGHRTGTFFFDAGRLYFATVEGVAMSGAELADAGIDRAQWQAASQRPGARLNFVAELIDVGCPRKAVEHFVKQRLEATIDALTLAAGPVIVSKGRHGFGASISFSPSALIGPTHTPELEGPPVQQDALVSLATVDPHAVVTLDGEAWNSLSELLSPARYAELVDILGARHAEHLVTSLGGSDLVTIVQPHDALDPWADEADQIQSHPLAPDEPPAASTLFSRSEPDIEDDQDDDEYVPDRVGRQAYAAMASMRAASRAEPPPQEKARALRRLIEAVRGL